MTKSPKTSEVFDTPRPGELLVAIMNDRRDMAIAREQGMELVVVGGPKTIAMQRCVRESKCGLMVDAPMN